MNATILSTIIIFLVFSLWFINKYLNILYKNEAAPQNTEYKESNVIPNLIQSVNYNDQKILDEVNKNKEEIEDLGNTVQNKMNQIETNKLNISKVFDNIENVRDKINQDQLKNLEISRSKLQKENNKVIGRSIDELSKAWETTNEIAMSNINSSIEEKKVEIQQQVYDTVSSNVENNFVPSTELTTFSNSVDNRFNTLNGSISEINTNLDALSNQFETQQSDLNSFETTYVEQEELNMKINEYLQQSIDDSSGLGGIMGKYLNSNDYAKKSDINTEINADLETRVYDLEVRPSSDVTASELDLNLSLSSDRGLCLQVSGSNICVPTDVLQKTFYTKSEYQPYQEKLYE